MIRMSLKSKYNPIVDDIKICIPRRLLSNDFFIDILPKDQPIMLYIFYSLEYRKSGESNQNKYR